jgi:hypothetical protein
VFQDLPHEWRNVFYVGAAFYAFGTVFLAHELQKKQLNKILFLKLLITFHILVHILRSENYFITIKHTGRK